MNNYTQKLSILDFQAQTIDTNLMNYQKRLEVINQKTKAQTISNTELNFLAEFIKLVTEKYLPQIKQETESFERGLKLLENNNNAIRSRVEVERLKSDRNFQDIVAVVGSVTVTVGLLKEGKSECKFLLKIPQVPKDKPSLCDYTLFYGIVVGICVGFLVWWLRKRLLADKQ